MAALSNSEYFEQIAIIDAGMFMLEKWQKESCSPQDPILALIDRATGYDLNRFKNLKIILSDIKEAKIKIGEATTTEDEVLEILKKQYNL